MGEFCDPIELFSVDSEPLKEMIQKERIKALNQKEYEERSICPLLDAGLSKDGI